MPRPARKRRASEKLAEVRQPRVYQVSSLRAASASPERAVRGRRVELGGELCNGLLPFPRAAVALVDLQMRFASQVSAEDSLRADLPSPRPAVTWP
jgi:hypothetical protein